MAIRKKTIRRMPPKTREFARIINELKSVLTRLENRLLDIASMELDSIALLKVREFTTTEKQVRTAPVKTEPLFAGMDQTGTDQQPGENQPAPIKSKRTRKKKTEVSNAESQTESNSTP